MKFTSLRRSRSPVAPKPTGPGGLVAPKPLSVGGFTLIEIVIVAATMVLLSWLSLAVIDRARNRAVRSSIEHHLRQLYHAKEYSFSELGHAHSRTAQELFEEGYLKQALLDRLITGDTYEGHLGWQYATTYWPNDPVYAYQGQEPMTLGPDHERIWRRTNDQVIWYPHPPDFPSHTVSSSPAAAGPANTPQPAPSNSARGPGNSDFGHAQGNGNSNANGQENRNGNDNGNGRGNSKP